MNTKVIVEPQQAFDQWMQEQQVAAKETINQAVAVNPAISPAISCSLPATLDSQTLQQIHNHHH